MESLNGQGRQMKRIAGDLDEVSNFTAVIFCCDR